jgi:uncharacterized protein YbaR (Trm112 family)
MPENTSGSGLDPAFLALLHCPLGESRPPLRLVEDGTALICEQCDCGRKGHRFPFTDGFPDLRPVDDAQKPSEITPEPKAE